MSILKTEICIIDRVDKHPNADNLDLVWVKGWICVVRKDTYKLNDFCIFISPEDSVLPDELCNMLWPEGSKIKRPSGGRLRTEKIRKTVSQGMCLNPKDPELLEKYPDLAYKKCGDDVASILGITKWEPKDVPTNLKGQATKNHPDFKKYTDIENIKHYPNVFNPGDNVIVTEKCHGTNARFAKLPKLKLNWFEKIAKFFGYKQYEFCVGSRNVHLKFVPDDAKLYGDLGTGKDNVYNQVARKFKFDQILAPGETLFGEIIGPSIQSGYHYGLKPGQYSFVAFDLMRDGKYVSFNEFNIFCKTNNISRVPVLYVGDYDLEKITKLASGPSVLNKTQPIIEGVVVKCPFEIQDPRAGRRVFKVINPDYLMRKGNTEWS